MRSAKIWFSLSAHEVLQVDHEVLNVRAGPFRKQFLAQGPRERGACPPKSNGAHCGSLHRRSSARGWGLLLETTYLG